MEWTWTWPWMEVLYVLFSIIQSPSTILSNPSTAIVRPIQWNECNPQNNGKSHTVHTHCTLHTVLLDPVLYCAVCWDTPQCTCTCTWNHCRRNDDWVGSDSPSWRPGAHRPLCVWWILYSWRIDAMAMKHGSWNMEYETCHVWPCKKRMKKIIFARAPREWFTFSRCGEGIFVIVTRTLFCNLRIHPSLHMSCHVLFDLIWFKLDGSSLKFIVWKDGM